MTGQMPSAEDDLLEFEFVRQRLGVSRWWLGEMVRRRVFAHVRPNRNSIKFTPAQYRRIVAFLSVDEEPEPAPMVRGMSNRNARRRRSRRRAQSAKTDPRE